MPPKRISSMEEFLLKFPEAKDLFVDGVERPIQRPKETSSIQERKSDI